MKAQIKGVYGTNKDGQPLVTRKGDPYKKILFSLENGDSHYEGVFQPTERSYWVIESLFGSAGLEAPAPAQFSLSLLDSLIGRDVEIIIGQNKGGYPAVKKYIVSKPVDVVDGNPDEVAEQTADADSGLDEGVPF